MHVQPLIRLPRPAGYDSGAVGTHVFCKALLGSLADIQAAEVHPYGESNAIFQTLCQSFHGTPYYIRE
jgi:hypothetical protein